LPTKETIISRQRIQTHHETAQLGSSRRITIGTVIEECNVGEVERLLDGTKDLFLRRSPRRWRKCRTWRC